MKFKNTTEKDCKKIPYEIKNGDIELDIVDAYDVREQHKIKSSRLGAFYL